MLQWEIMKRCFRKKNIGEFGKCLVKTFRVFYISIFYSPFIFKLRKPVSIFLGVLFGDFMVGAGPYSDFKYKEKEIV